MSSSVVRRAKRALAMILARAPYKLTLLVTVGSGGWPWAIALAVVGGRLAARGYVLGSRCLQYLLGLFDPF